MDQIPLLSIITFLPLFGCAFIWLINGEEEVVAQNARNVALWTSCTNFLLSLLLLFQFKSGDPSYQFVERYTWLLDFKAYYHMGVDGISLFFVLLTTFLIPLCILSSWKAIQKRVREYMLAFLLLETLLIGMFCALDLLLFYVFFEGVLIPMVMIIGIWGGERRIHSAFKFFLYTLFGSVLMLVAMIVIYQGAGTTDIAHLSSSMFSPDVQFWLWLAFFAAFAVKVPMWPLHTWLPDAHVEAPTAGSVILAGVLLKMGGYGFLRFSIPLFPAATEFFTPFVFALSVIAVIYTSLVALVQSDIKKLVAYSSVAHMGLVTLGIFTMTSQGVSGAMMQMISHGLVSAALFLCVGVIYDRFHTRELKYFGGLVKGMPVYAVLLLFFILASIGVPGTSGFVGELLVLLGAFEANTWVASLSATGMILGAAYALWLYRRVIFGEQKPGLDLSSLRDLNFREAAILAPIGVLVFVMGICPQPILDIVSPAVDRVIAQHQAYKSSILVAQVLKKENEGRRAPGKGWVAGKLLPNNQG